MEQRQNSAWRTWCRLGHLRRVRGGGGGARRLHRQQPVFLVGVHDRSAFLLPYGHDLVRSSAPTYTGDGGLYDWINKALPDAQSWGARASWYYWINFPLWMASLAVVCPEPAERARVRLAVRWLASSLHRAGLHLDRHRGSRFTRFATASSS
ncbi:MAG: hypothetical protein ACLUNO_08095 [Oscillospiraceae bacterium]